MTFICTQNNYPPASEASREVANPYTPVYGVKEFVCLSVCYKLWPQLSQDWLNRMGKKKLIYDFLAGNNYPDSPHSQGVWNLPHKFHLYLINNVL